MKHYYIILLIIMCLCSTSSSIAKIKNNNSSIAYIDNVNPRLDTNGNIMDIHDGSILYADGTYYYYGDAFGDCIEPPGPNGCIHVRKGLCGFRTDHKVAVYTSKDFMHWEAHPPAFEVEKEFKTPAVMFSPKVIYNKLTKQYVLWYNWLDASDGVPLFSKSYYGVAISSSPLGPFKVANPKVSLKYPDTGDLHLFVDDDKQNTAYIIYTSYIQGPEPSHRMSIERLSQDYLSSTKENSGFIGDTFVEAPAMFKRNGIYYAVFGPCTCYGAEGSANVVYTAKSPFGPYTRQKLAISGNIPAQQTDITPVYTVNGTVYLWRGDRWQSANDKIKGHDFTYIGPLNFSASGVIDPLIWQNHFELEMP